MRRKEGHQAMNRDQGSYQLSHACDRLLDATANRRIKTRKNWVPASSNEDLVMRSKRQNKVLKFWLWYMNFLLCIVIPTKWIYFSIGVPNVVYETLDSAFTVNIQCVYPRLHHKPSVPVKTHKLPALAFHSWLRVEVTRCELPSTCQDFAVLVITR